VLEPLGRRHRNREAEQHSGPRGFPAHQIPSLASTTREKRGVPRSHRINDLSAAGGGSFALLVTDFLFVVLTVALFAALTVLIRAVERW
jgi:hypothetical protein